VFFSYVLAAKDSELRRNLACERDHARVLVLQNNVGPGVTSCMVNNTLDLKLHLIGGLVDFLIPDTWLRPLVLADAP
jgi:hypothetical protein